MRARAFQVVLVGGWLASCTAHGDAGAIDVGHVEQVEQVEQVVPDRFAWLAEVEPPSLEDDRVLDFAAAPIRCSPAEPRQPRGDTNEPLLTDLRMMGEIYDDQPEVPGFNVALGLPLAAKPTIWTDPSSETLRWEVEGELGGFERITRDHRGKPIRVDGFDPAGEWRRTALFESGLRSLRRVEFEVVDGEPIRRRTLVFEHDQVVAVTSPEQVEYWHARTDDGSRSVVFERYPDRLVRTAQVYEDGVPHERVDTFESAPWPATQ